MSASSNSRTRVLSSIHEATASVASDRSQLPEQYSAINREYVRKGRLSTDQTIPLLIERLREYDAEVHECCASDLVQAISSCLSASGRRVFLAPPATPEQWLIPGFDWRIDKGMSHDEIEAADGVVTAASCAIADSGTIALHHSAREGRRVLTLLPDWQLCILFASQVVETLPEYFARATPTPALVTWISGPSATADIEMTRIKGVHGPRNLKVIIVRDDT